MNRVTDFNNMDGPIEHNMNDDMLITLCDLYESKINKQITTVTDAALHNNINNRMQKMKANIYHVVK